MTFQAERMFCAKAWRYEIVMIIRHLIEPLSHAFECLCSQTFLQSFIYAAKSSQELGTACWGNHVTEQGRL